MESEPQTPNPIMSIGAWLVCVGIVGAVMFLILPPIGKQEVTSASPSRALCFDLAQQDLPDHSPAYWIERHGLENHSHRTRTSLRCTADLNGKLTEFDADQIWVARSGNETSDMR